MGHQIGAEPSGRARSLRPRARLLPVDLEITFAAADVFLGCGVSRPSNRAWRSCLSEFSHQPIPFLPNKRHRAHLA